MKFSDLSFTERHELDEQFKLYCTKEGVAYTPFNMLAFLQQKQKAEQKHHISYMNDNHTFVELTDDVEESLTLIKYHFVDNGQAHGMLCRKGNEPVHAEGNWSEFEGKVREWYKINVEVA